MKQPLEQTVHNENVLLEAGFRKVGDWQLEGGKIALAGDIPKEPAVYAHVIDGHVYYIGSATMGLKKRLYFYAKPGVSQRTSLRVNALIADALAAGKRAWVLAAFPEASVWNSLPVCFVTGLEAGLVKELRPPWNKRGI